MDEVQGTAPAGLTEERWASLLAYCKLAELADDPEVRTLLPLMYADAVGYMEGAGVSQPEAGTPRAAQYDLCVNYLVANAWDHRDLVETAVSGKTVQENPAYRARLNQLKWTEPPWG